MAQPDLEAGRFRIGELSAKVISCEQQLKIHKRVFIPPESAVCVKTDVLKDSPLQERVWDVTENLGGGLLTDGDPPRRLRRHASDGGDFQERHNYEEPVHEI